MNEKPKVIVGFVPDSMVVVDHAEAVEFAPKLDDGTSILLKAKAADFGAFVLEMNRLQGALNTAQKARGPLTQNDLAAPFRATAGKAGVFADNTIALQFVADSGAILTVSLSAQETTRLLAMAQKALLDLSQGQARKLN